MTRCVLLGSDRLRETAFAGSRWLEGIRLWRPYEPDTLTTRDVETAVVLLGGTFDLVAAGTAWPARGARATPFAGRPMAVFLPPRTEFRVANGPADRSGELLLVSARQPAAPAPATGRDVLSQKPLLPLAGSGKAFDPGTGEWRPAETFPTSPESLPPRRIERLDAGGVPLERVFPPTYKAATISVDEAVVPAGAALRLADVPARPACDEVAVFLRPSRTADVGHRTGASVHAGDAVHWFAADDVDGFSVAAVDGPCYVLLAYAGKR